MYEIDDSATPIADLAKTDAIRDRMDALRVAMNGAGHLIPYLLQGDLVEAALEESERYFEYLAEWNALYPRAYPFRAPGGGDDAA